MMIPVGGVQVVGCVVVATAGDNGSTSAAGFALAVGRDSLKPKGIGLRLFVKGKRVA
jgi:hypothetical protein